MMVRTEHEKMYKTNHNQGCQNTWPPPLKCISGYVGTVTASLLCFMICSEISLGGEDYEPRGDVMLAERMTYGEEREVPGLTISETCTSGDSMCPQYRT